jgi:FixJ family two-component response regulator
LPEGNNMDKPPLVSIVDDDPSVRKALGRLCKSVGYGVELYDSSESFLNANAADKTDCLILDVNLPGKSGLELQAELIVADNHCPIVFITAFDDDHARTKALEDGAIDFLGKPLDVDQLLKIIERALSEM